MLKSMKRMKIHFFRYSKYSKYLYIYMSYGQNLAHGEGTSCSRVGPYRFCSGCALYKPSWGYRFGYRFRVGPYRFCSNGKPTTLSILLWSYLILSDIHINIRICDIKWMKQLVDTYSVFSIDWRKSPGFSWFLLPGLSEEFAPFFPWSFWIASMEIYIMRSLKKTA